MRHIAASFVTVLACIGVGYAVHAHDTSNTNSVIVSNYNGGFVDGLCAGSVAVAEKQYHFVCKGY